VKYQDLVQKVKLMPRKTVPVSTAMGSVLGEGVLNVTVGTEIDSQVMRYFMDNDIKQVSICDGLEVEAVSVPLTRVVNQSGNWLAAMNHRYLKTNLRDAALHGQSSNIHGYSPVAAYAYGAELGHGEEGRY
jgi:hypothetical protein